MPFKYDAAGNIVTQDVDGKKLPVFVDAKGAEAPLDGDANVAKINQLNGEAMTHRKAKETAEATLKAFTDAGVSDPAAAAKALATVKNLNDKQLVDAGEVEKVKNEAVKAVEAQYAPVKARVGELEGQLSEYLVRGAFTGSKFVAEKFAAEGPAGVDVAYALFARQFKVENGKLVGYDSSGNKLFSQKKPGELADADEAVELMVNAYPHKASILKASGAAGSGAKGGVPAGQGTMTRAQFTALDPATQMKTVQEGKTVITD